MEQIQELLMIYRQFFECMFLSITNSVIMKWIITFLFSTLILSPIIYLTIRWFVRSHSKEDSEQKRLSTIMLLIVLLLDYCNCHLIYDWVVNLVY